MATRKQQKRRQRRTQGRGPVREGAVPARPPDERRSGAHAASRAGGGRGTPPPAPSYLRAARRALVYCVLWFVLLQVTHFGGSRSAAANLLLTALFFVPLWGVGYLTEVMRHWAWRRRQAEGSP